MKNEIQPLLRKFLVFAKNTLNFRQPPRLFLKNDSENSKCMLGRTAHYDPQNKSVTLYVSRRHPKDILRSFAHELVHHCQNERGDLAPEKMKTMNQNYAQENDHMRKMEKEAYLLGNMCFRDWEDSLDDKLQFKMKIAEQQFLKENKKMSVKISKKVLKTLIEKILKEQFGEMPDVRAKAAADAKNRRGEPAPVKKPKKKKRLPPGPGPGRCELDDDECDDDTALAEEAIAEAFQTLPCGHKISEGCGCEEKEDLDESGGRDDDDETEACKHCKGKGCVHCQVAEGNATGDEDDDSDDDDAPESAGNDGTPPAPKKDEQDGPMESEPAPDDDGDEPVLNESWTPEAENLLYEKRFSNRNSKLFEKLTKKWTK